MESGFDQDDQDDDGDDEMEVKVVGENFRRPTRGRQQRLRWRRRQQRLRRNPYSSARFGRRRKSGGSPPPGGALFDDALSAGDRLAAIGQAVTAWEAKLAGFASKFSGSPEVSTFSHSI